MALPRLSSGRSDKNFGLMPKRIIALDGDGKTRHFRWKMNRFGQIGVVQQSEMTPFARGQKCVVCIDPRLLFRRRSNLAVQNRMELDRIARDFFPFSATDSVAFAYARDQIANGNDTENAGDNLILALPDQDWAAMQKNIPVPVAAVLCSEAAAPAIQSALEQRFASGTLPDLSPNPARFVAPAIFALFAWVAVLTVILLSGYGMWRFQNDWQRNKLSGEIAALESEVLVTKQRFEAMQAMRATLSDFQDFQMAENNGLHKTLVQLVQTLPQGVSIDRIEFKDGKLSISGLGRDPKDWLAGFGITPGDIEITPLPQYNRYVAVMNLSPQAAKQPARP